MKIIMCILIGVLSMGAKADLIKGSFAGILERDGSVIDINVAMDTGDAMWNSFGGLASYTHFTWREFTLSNNGNIYDYTNLTDNRGVDARGTIHLTNDQPINNFNLDRLSLSVSQYYSKVDGNVLTHVYTSAFIDFYSIVDHLFSSNSLNDILEFSFNSETDDLNSSGYYRLHVLEKNEASGNIIKSIPFEDGHFMINSGSLVNETALSKDITTVDEPSGLYLVLLFCFLFIIYARGGSYVDSRS